MKVQFDIVLDVDARTGERFISASPKHLLKMVELLAANRPETVTMSKPLALKEPDGTTLEADGAV